MIHQILAVEGMSCDHCRQSISKAVGDIAGVSKVEVDLDKKEVVVDFNEDQTNLQAISLTISESGFEVVNS